MALKTETPQEHHCNPQGFECQVQADVPKFSCQNSKEEQETTLWWIFGSFGWTTD